MPDPSALIGHWGYWTIFVIVLLGNVGMPVPEEAVLLLAGYLVWEGQLWLPAVLVFGIASAVTGDNLGYWVARSYGRVVERYERWIFIKPEQFNSAKRLVARYGAIGVFISRFLPGLRFMAGPLAGIMGMPFARFFVANVLGAAAYVPLAVGAGYAVGYGLGDYIESFQRVIGRIEYVFLLAVITCAVIILLIRSMRVRKSLR